MKGILLATAMALPILVQAQPASSLSRAQVRDDVIRFERAGYNPSTSDSTAYPENVQAAQRRLANGEIRIGARGSIFDHSVESGAGKTFYPGDDTQ
jgi:hypothetical protein